MASSIKKNIINRTKEEESRIGNFSGWQSGNTAGERVGGLSDFQRANLSQRNLQLDDTSQARFNNVMSGAYDTFASNVRNGAYKEFDDAVGRNLMFSNASKASNQEKDYYNYLLSQKPSDAAGYLAVLNEKYKDNPNPFGELKSKSDDLYFSAVKEVMNTDSNKNDYIKAYNDWVNGIDYNLMSNASRFDVGAKENYNTATDEEKYQYGKILANEGPDAAREYLERLQNRVGSRYADETAKKLYKFSAKHPFYGTALSVGTNLYSGLAAYPENVLNTILGKGVNRGSIANVTSEAGANLRQGVSDQIENPFLNFAYNAGMSGIDNVAQIAATFGLSEFVPLISMSAGAANQSVLELVKQGVNPGEAIIRGGVSGAIEYATEKIGMDNLFDMAVTRTGSFKSLMKQLGKNLVSQAGAEGAEEALSDVLNWVADDVADIIKQQPLQSWKDEMQPYLDQGMTEAQAIGEVLKNRTLELGYDAAAGAFSGLFLGFGGSMVKTRKAYSDNVKNLKARADSAGNLSQFEASEIINQAKAVRNSTVQQQADKIEQKYANGESVSVSEVAKLATNVQTLRSTLSKESNLDIDANYYEDAFNEYGELEDPLADAIEYGKSLPKNTKAFEVANDLEQRSNKGETIGSQEALRALALGHATYDNMSKSQRVDFDARLRESEKVIESAAEKANTAINNINKINEQMAEIPQQIDDKMVTARKQDVGRYINATLNGKAGKAVFASMYTSDYARRENSSPAAYTSEMRRYYEAGMYGDELSSVKLPNGVRSVLNEAQKMAAYNAGVEDEKANVNKYIEEEIINGEENGEQILPGVNGWISDVSEGVAAENLESTGRKEKKADVKYKDSAKDLGIEYGTSNKTCTVVSEAEFTEEDKRVFEACRKLNVLLLVVDGIPEVSIDGKKFNMRGAYIASERRIIASRDYVSPVTGQRFTLTQIVKHELLHDLFTTKPELISKMNEELKEKLGPDEYKRLWDEHIYRCGTAYGNDVLLEEFLCDSVAGMNAFDERNKGYEAHNQSAKTKATEVAMNNGYLDQAAVSGYKNKGPSYVNFSSEDIKMQQETTKELNEKNVEKLLNSPSSDTIRELFNTTKEKADNANKGLKETIDISFVSRRYPSKVRSSVRTTGLGITREFIKRGFIDFRGTKLSKDNAAAAEQLATMAMVLRNPSFETFRIFYTKNGEIVGSEATTSYLVEGSRTSKEKNEHDMVEAMKDRMKRLNADGYYLLHNHPSGDPAPSSVDVDTSLAYAQSVKGYLGHIVIDHNKYGFIDNNGNIKQSATASTESVDFKQRVIDNPNLYKSILSPDDLFDIAKSVVHTKDYSSIVFAGSDGSVRAIQEVHNNFALSKDFQGFVKNRKREFGSFRAFLITESPEIYWSSDTENAYYKNLFSDVIEVSNRMSYNADGYEVGNFNSLGQKEFEAYRVGENTKSSAKLDGEYMNAVDNNDIRFSAESKPTEADNNYLDAVNNNDMETAEKLVSEAAKAKGAVLDADGEALHIYHGTGRADRVGNVFRSDRATSGPMAFFTTSKNIAESYSKDKKDTSLAYDERYRDYTTQFRMEKDGKDYSIYDLWDKLPARVRTEIRQRAGQVTFDDEWENIELNPDVSEGTGGFRWNLKEAKQNAIRALTEEWLNSGTLYGEEVKFLQVLELSGVKEALEKAGYTNLQYFDPEAKSEKVYDAFLFANNVFDAAKEVDSGFVDEFIEWYEQQDQDKYERETADADMWDKNNQDAYSFADRMRRDIENGTSGAWTSIPDSMTDFLKEKGYDAIKDKGGKNGGDGHTVYIPFYSEQVKSAETVTYDDKGNVIPVSERFNSKSNDIRFSVESTPEDSEGNKLSQQQIEYFKDSKARDENGNLLVVYHGTPDGGFTVFNSDQSYYTDDPSVANWFTDNLDIINKYYNVDNSRSENGKQLYKVYLNMTNPLIIDAHGDGWNQIKVDSEIRDGVNYRYRNFLTDEWVLTDKLTTEQIAEYAKKNGYDGVVFKNVRDGSVNEEPSDIYAVFESNQIKNTDNLKPTDSSDIRFSVETASEEADAYTRTLEKRLADAQQQIEELQKEFRRSKKGYLKRSHKIASFILADFNSDLDAKYVTEQLQQIAVTVVDENSISTAKLQAASLARDIITSSKKAVEGTGDIFGVRDYIRKSKIRVSPELKTDIPDYNDFRKSYFGKIKLGNAGISVDTLYQELNEKFGNAMFPIEIDTQYDQLLHICDVYDSLETIYENPYEGNLESAIDEATNMIIDTCIESLGVKQTYADKMASKVNEANKDARAARREADRANEDANEYKKALQRANEKLDLYIKLKQEAVDGIKKHYKDIAERRKAEKENNEVRTSLLKVGQRLERLEKKSTRVEAADIQKLLGNIDFASKTLTGYTINKLSSAEAEYLKKTASGELPKDPVLEREFERLRKEHINGRRVDLGTYESRSEAVKEAKKFEEANGVDVIVYRNKEQNIYGIYYYEDQMSIEQVKDLLYLMETLEKQISNSRKTIATEDRRDIYAQGEASIRAIESIDTYKRTKRAYKNGIIDKWITTETLRPATEMLRIVGYDKSVPLYQRYLDLEKGQLKQLDYQRRAYEDYFDKFLKDKKLIKDMQSRKIEIEPNVYVTPDQLMSLYMNTFNDANMKHLMLGGITIPDYDKYIKGKYEDAITDGKRIRFKKDELVKLAKSHLNQKEFDFIRSAQKYYNEMSKKELDDTSELLLGHSIAKVGNYWRIVTDKNWRDKNFDEVTRDGSLANSGFTKSREANAATPLQLIPFSQQVDIDVKSHSAYVGLAIPIRNFSKVFDVNLREFDETGRPVDLYHKSLKEVLNDKFGKSPDEYIGRMLSNIQNESVQRETWMTGLSKLRSFYAGSALTLALGVAVKQTASYPTAAAILGTKPLAKAFKNSIASRDSKMIAKYSPLMRIRLEGYNNVDLGDIREKKTAMSKVLDSEWKFGPLKGVKKLDWINNMDIATVKKLWIACEYYVRDNFKDIDPSDKEKFYSKVGEIHTEVIAKTQPNYSALQRPHILRSSSDLTKSLMMFKTQPFQNFNILYEANGMLKRAKSAIKNNPHPVNSEEYREYNEKWNKELETSKKNFGRAVGSQLAASFVFALMQFAWDAFRGRADKYKDKDDEWKLMSWLKTMGVNMASNGFGMIPLGSVAFEMTEVITDAIVAGISNESVFDAVFYGIDASTATDSINSLAKAVIGAVQLVFKTDLTAKEHIREFVGLAEDFSGALGVPLGNLNTLIKSSTRHAMFLVNGRYEGEWEYTKLFVDERYTSKSSKLYKNILIKAKENDPSAYDRLYAEAKSQFSEEDMKKIDKAINDAGKTSSAEKYGDKAEMVKKELYGSLATGKDMSDVENISESVWDAFVKSYASVEDGNGKRTQKEVHEALENSKLSKKEIDALYSLYYKTSYDDYKPKK